MDKNIQIEREISLKTKQYISIKDANKEITKKYAPAIHLIKMDKFVVTDMNLRSNIGTLLKRASMLTVWSKNEDFQVQIELVLYEGSDQWEIEYCLPIGDTSISATTPMERMKQWKRVDDYKEYAHFVIENKNRMLKYLLEEYEITKEKLSLY